MPEKEILVGGPADGHRIPGTVEFNCVKCGDVVVVSPSGQRWIVAQGAVVMCLKCAVIENGGAPKVNAVPGAREELLQWLAGRRRN